MKNCWACAHLEMASVAVSVEVEVSARVEERRFSAASESKKLTGL